VWLGLDGTDCRSSNVTPVAASRTPDLVAVTGVRGPRPRHRGGTLWLRHHERGPAAPRDVRLDHDQLTGRSATGRHRSLADKDRQRVTNGAISDAGVDVRPTSRVDARRSGQCHRGDGTGRTAPAPAQYASSLITLPGDPAAGRSSGTLRRSCVTIVVTVVSFTPKGSIQAPVGACCTGRGRLRLYGVGSSSPRTRNRGTDPARARNPSPPDGARGGGHGAIPPSNKVYSGAFSGASVLGPPAPVTRLINEPER
jgi:hypothetical protein